MPIKNEIGNKYGKLTVLSQGEIYKRNNSVKWICKCECGNLTQVVGSRLRNGDTITCGCGRRGILGDGYYEAIFKKMYATMKANSSKYNKFGDVLITYKEWKEIVLKPCTYCGDLVDTHYSYNRNYRITGKHSHVAIFNGVDRIDSDKGYTIDNVTSCCITCNRMKLNSKVNDFLNHIIKIYKFKITQ